MSTETSAPPTTRVGFFINRNYTWLWFGQGISLLGDEIFDITLVVWIATVLARTPDGGIAPWAPLAVSGVLIAATVPVFLVGPLAGVFVDRWPKRRTMLVADALRAVLVLSLLLFSNTLPLPFGHVPLNVTLTALYAIVFLASVCAQFFNPARTTIIGDVVPHEHLGRATGLGQTSASLATIIGPPLAAPLLIGFGVQWALIINAFSFVGSFLAIRQVRVAADIVPARDVATRGNVSKEFREGLGFTWRSPVLNALLVAASIATLGAGAINTLNVFFIKQNLGVDASFVGVLGSIFGIGAILGAIVGSLVVDRLGPARVFSASVVVMGVLFLAFARQTAIGGAIALIFSIGVLQALLNITTGPLLLGATPRELLGRVVSVINPSIMIASLISVAAAGYLASTVLRGFHTQVGAFTFGPIDTIFTGSGLLIVLGGVYALAQLGRATTPPPAAEAPEAEATTAT
jgi:MFS family permease